MTKLIATIIGLLSFHFAFISADVLNSESRQRPSWLTNSHRNRIELFKKWLESKPGQQSALSKSHDTSSPIHLLHPQHQFKGCIDPSEPFQCPQSEVCIALQFICDGHPGDCPGNLDENEETCIAAKRPAKENIEKNFCKPNGHFTDQNYFNFYLVPN